LAWGLSAELYPTLAAFSDYGAMIVSAGKYVR
jgi:hypothetical protein